MLTGENGILTQAQNASEETTKAEEEEKIQMAVLGSSIVDNGYAEVLDTDSFTQELQNQFGSQKLDIVANGDGSFIITVEDTQRKYYVNDDKTVINSDNMIEISTAEELANLSQDVKNGNTYEGKAILLTNDIDLKGEEWTPIGYYPMENSTPADETNKPFKGIFDGCGYEVDNFTINTTEKVQGLFGLVDNGKVANVGVGSSSSINGGIGTAGVVGYAYNGTKVYNCYNKASITGTDNVSGIVAITLENCTISNCYNKASITGTNNVSGIVARTLENCTISNCYNSGYISGEIYTGGITATINDNVTIRGCYNIGNIDSTAWTGGIAGYTQSMDLEGNLPTNCEISLCYNKGNIIANGSHENSSNVGGIMGLSLNTNIFSCYNSGTITGQYRHVGGIVGLNRGTLENSYNIGTVSGPTDRTGAIVGYNNEFYYDVTALTYIGETHNCYSLEGVTSKLFGENNSIIGEECSFKNSDELKGLYEVLGDAFKEDIENKKNNGYPILSWE